MAYCRNVIWDLHRPENKLIAANKEVIMGMPNRGAAKESFIPMLTMRIMYPFFFDNKIKCLTESKLYSTILAKMANIVKNMIICVD